MDLVGWSLNTFDNIFSTQRQGAGAASCPSGTHPAGFTSDAWNKWKVLCLSVLSVEDAVDPYLFGFMITGFLLFGIDGYLVYRQS